MTTNSILTENGYTVEQTISGYYRLMRGENIILDDSACEDYYDEDTATAMFTSYLKEYAHGVFTLDDLAAYINNSVKMPDDVSEIIAANGWNDETATMCGVASDGERKVILNEDGIANVIEDED